MFVYVFTCFYQLSDSELGQIGAAPGHVPTEVTQVEYCMGFGDVSCTANVTYTENGSSVTQSADAVVVAVPLGVPRRQRLAPPGDDL